MYNPKPPVYPLRAEGGEHNHGSYSLQVIRDKNGMDFIVVKQTHGPTVTVPWPYINTLEDDRWEFDALARAARLSVG